MIYQSYYIQLKNGEIRYKDKKPLKAIYIKEIMERINNNQTDHIYLLFINGEMKQRKDISFFCGYDRQIKHNKVLNDLFNIN